MGCQHRERSVPCKGPVAGCVTAVAGCVCRLCNGFTMKEKSIQVVCEAGRRAGSLHVPGWRSPKHTLQPLHVFGAGPGHPVQVVKKINYDSITWGAPKGAWSCERQCPASGMLTTEATGGSSGGRDDRFERRRGLSAFAQ